MGQMENKFAQVATGTKNEEKEDLAVEKKAVENIEVIVGQEQVEALAKGKTDEIAKTSESVMQEGSKKQEDAEQTGIKLGFTTEEIASNVEEARKEMKANQEKTAALTKEKTEEINNKVAEAQPESAQETKVNENSEAPVKSHEDVQVELHAKNAETIRAAKSDYEQTVENLNLSDQEAREKWEPSNDGTQPGLSPEEKLAYCDPKIVSKEMSDDLQLKNSPERKPFSGESFSENNKVINENIHNLVEGYIGEAKISREYGEKIRKSTEDYVGLISKAQHEGSVAKDLKAEDIQKISADIVNKMVYQNRESLKRGVGDHGVRHIIDGNIAEAMKMTDEFNNANPEKQLTSLDRLKIMTIHFNHDMGYTVGVVRKGFAAMGEHQNFSEKIFNSQGEMYGKLFGEKDLEQMSKTIKTHDKETTDFEKTPLESIVRLSDNMGLFHDSKLPEIFYSVPENMAVLQKIDLARKAGQSIEGLKKKLKENVMKQGELPEDEGGLNKDTVEALLNAAEDINDKAANFNLGMMAGKLDGYEMQGSKMVVNIRESDMHKQIQGLFNLNQKQFVKALESYKIDLSGAKFDDFVTTEKDVDGNIIKQYVDLPMGAENPALRFNFLPEDISKPDEKNVEVKKKFAETATEWVGINIRAEINSTVKELKESKESRTLEGIQRISFGLQAQIADERMSAEDFEQMKNLVDDVEGSLGNDEEFSDKIEQLGKFLTKKEKDFLAVE